MWCGGSTWINHQRQGWNSARGNASSWFDHLTGRPFKLLNISSSANQSTSLIWFYVFRAPWLAKETSWKLIQPIRMNDRHLALRTFSRLIGRQSVEWFSHQVPIGSLCFPSLDWPEWLLWFQAGFEVCLYFCVQRRSSFWLCGAHVLETKCSRWNGFVFFVYPRLPTSFCVAMLALANKLETNFLAYQYYLLLFWERRSNWGRCERETNRKYLFCLVSSCDGIFGWKQEQQILETWKRNFPTCCRGFHFGASLMYISMSQSKTEST